MNSLIEKNKALVIFLLLSSVGLFVGSFILYFFIFPRNMGDFIYLKNATFLSGQSMNNPYDSVSQIGSGPASLMIIAVLQHFFDPETIFGAWRVLNLVGYSFFIFKLSGFSISSLWQRFSFLSISIWLAPIRENFINNQSVGLCLGGIALFLTLRKCSISVVGRTIKLDYFGGILLILSFELRPNVTLPLIIGAALFLYLNQSLSRFLKQIVVTLLLCYLSLILSATIFWSNFIGDFRIYIYWIQRLLSFASIPLSSNETHSWRSLSSLENFQYFFMLVPVILVYFLVSEKVDVSKFNLARSLNLAGVLSLFLSYIHLLDVSIVAITLLLIFFRELRVVFSYPFFLPSIVFLFIPFRVITFIFDYYQILLFLCVFSLVLVLKYNKCIQTLILHSVYIFIFLFLGNPKENLIQKSSLFLYLILILLYNSTWIFEKYRERTYK